MRRRRLHIHIENLREWAPEYAAACDQVVDLVATREPEERLDLSCLIRVFSAESPVALHGDGSVQVNCNVLGRATWHFSPPTPENISAAELESLLRGGMFMHWRAMSPVHSFELDERTGCAAPPRWPLARASRARSRRQLRARLLDTVCNWARKVYDVNWLLRKVRLDPSPPGASPKETGERRRSSISSRWRRARARHTGGLTPPHERDVSGRAGVA